MLSRHFYPLLDLFCSVKVLALLLLCSSVTLVVGRRYLPRKLVHQPSTARCFGSMDKSPRTTKKKGVEYNVETGDVVSCLFCRINSREEPARIVYEDDKTIVFHTIKSATHLHLLVTPKEHIANARSLKGRRGAQLIRELKAVGQNALGAYSSSAKYCFHIPPWNSIDHLHLHAIASPGTMTMYNRAKYPSSTVFGYCRDADSLIAELEASDKSIDQVESDNNLKSNASTVDSTATKESRPSQSATTDGDKKVE